ncbi:MAG: hypothetical protein A2Y10_15840 [Planctomycetes bacterium GWF2_41_51]|nr:MAG: hypothetical protein A2Y10_15840 [Planctomycetes bacterium GWF2_41_51]HBG27596.1 hypothetical protein [Phycisphaerales bacterium]
MENSKTVIRPTENIGFILILIAILFYFFIMPDIVPQEVTSYPAQKLENGKLLPLNKTVYKVNPFMQTIIYWMPGIAETPSKLVNCIIKDRKNWIGYYSDGSGLVEMRKGKLVPNNVPNDYIYINRFHWWMLSLKNQ